MRKCKTCGLEATTEADLNNFIRQSRAKYGRENKCKSCKSAEFALWRLNNPNYRVAYHLANKETENKNSRKWIKENPAKSLAITRKYQAAKFSSIPLWFDAEVVNKIYSEAKTKGLEVDHIIPLQGKNVCGLHVQNNLRCITMQENRSKSNKLIE